MRTAIAFLLLIATAAFAQVPKPVAERLAAQNSLFDEQYESDLRNFPERATAFGDYRYNDRLSDYSLDAIRRRHEGDAAFLQRLEAIPTDGFSDQDQLSHDLLIRVLRQRIADFNLKEYEMPINTQSGIHTNLADLPLSVPLDSVKHYEDYISRLHQIPLALSQVTEVLRAGMKDKLMPVRFLAEKIPAQCQGIIDADPFLLPTKKYPASISPEDQKRLTQADHRRRQCRRVAGLQDICRLHPDGICPAGPHDAFHHFARGRPEALRKRYLRADHDAHDRR